MKLDVKKLPATLVLSSLLLLPACSKHESTTVDSSSSTESAAASTDTTMMTDTSMTSSAPMTDTTATAASTLAAPDTEFAAKATEGGIAEVDLGNLALQKATSPDVKQFAQMMVTDHSGANQQLLQILGTKSVPPTTQLSPEHQQMKSTLSTLSGAEFDRQYMAGQVKDHEATVGVFETESNSGTDAELKTFAASTLPKLREHLKMAQDTAAKVK